MPIHRRPGLDASRLDGVLSPDLDRGVAGIDLAQESFVDAYALVGLACFIASAARDGLPVRLVLPEDPDVRSWLSRMHLGAVIDAFGAWVEGALPRVPERDRRDTLIELERFDDAHGSDRLASFVWERLEGGADGEVVNQLFEATGELGLNVVEHAGSPAGGPPVFVTRPPAIEKSGTQDGFEEGAMMMSPGWTRPKSSGPSTTRAGPLTVPADAPVPRTIASSSLANRAPPKRPDGSASFRFPSLGGGLMVRQC
mgnify:CR=1 FL=1